MTEHVILLGIGGSHAHGLAHEDSDYDYRGVHSYTTEEFFHVNSSPAESIVTHDPDSTSHELKKFLRLAAKGNPDVLESLALDTYVDFDQEWGTRLLELTPSLLSTKAIKTAFIGYATQQFHALKTRHEEGNDSFSAGMGSRTWKHAKHLFRLLEAAEKVLTAGQLTPRVEDRDWYLSFLPNLTIDELITRYETRKREVEAANSVLPDEPDYDRINQFVIDYRKAH